MTNEEFIFFVKHFWGFLSTRVPLMVVFVTWLMWAWWLRREFGRRLAEEDLSASPPEQFVARSCRRWISYCGAVRMITLISALVLFFMYVLEQAIEASVGTDAGGAPDKQAERSLTIWGLHVNIVELLLTFQVFVYIFLTVFKYRSLWIVHLVYSDLKKSNIKLVEQ